MIVSCYDCPSWRSLPFPYKSEKALVVLKIIDGSPQNSINFAGQINSEHQWPKNEDYILTGLRKK
jgi:hypothetical protein